MGFLNRRTLLQAAFAAGLVPGLVAPSQAATIPPQGAFTDLKPWPGSGDQQPNAFEDITTYNNFYEFGTGKSDPSANAHTLVTKPWSVAVTGEACHRITSDAAEDRAGETGSVYDTVFDEKQVLTGAFAHQATWREADAFGKPEAASLLADELA